MTADWINARLSADCHHIGWLADTALLLHRNAILPWFILVPHTAGTDLLALEPAFRNRVIDEAALVAAFVREHFGTAKINFGALGNVVPQLHLHVIGRREGDACWPHPVWGHLQDSDQYGDTDRVRISDALQTFASTRFNPVVG